MSRSFFRAALLLALVSPLVALSAGPVFSQSDVSMLAGDTCGNDCILASCAANIAYCDGRRDDCLMQVCTLPEAEPNQRRKLPGTAVTCIAGDPACDAHEGDKVCGFGVSLCFNVGGEADPIERVKFRRPSQDRPVHWIDVANRDTIEAALVALGGEVQGKCRNRGKRGLTCGSDRACDTVAGAFDGRCMRRSVVFDPPLASANVCTPLFRYDVQLRFEGNALSFGRSEIRIRAHRRTAGLSGLSHGQDGDLMAFTCLP